MSQILAGAILALVGVFFALTLIIVCNKIWRDDRERRRARHRARVEPALMCYAAGQISLSAALDGCDGDNCRSLVETVLLEATQNAGPQQANRLTRALEKLGFVDERIDELESRSWWTRAAAAETLGRTGSRRAAAPLIESLKDEWPEVRLRAASALAELGGATAVRPLIRILDEPSRWSTIRVANILEHKGPEIIGDLIVVYSELGLPGRIAVLDILADLGATDATDWIQKKLTDRDPDIRARAAHALGALKSEDSGPVLLPLLYDGDWPVRAMAAKALGQIGYAEAIDTLCVALRDDSWWVRANAAEALCRTGPDGLQALEQMLDDADSFAGQQAVRVLEDSGIVDQQVNDLAASDQATRDSARLFVEKVIGTGQCDRLRELAEQHADSAVRWILEMMVPESQAQEEDAA